MSVFQHVDVTTANDDSACSVAFITLGCAKNEVDTASMRKRTAEAGFRLVEDVSEADAVVVNTCSFIQAATEESLSTIFDISALPEFEKGEKKIIVAGCMPARYGGELESELVEAAAFVPCSKEDDIVDVLSRVLNADAPGSSIVYHPWEGEPAAYAKISDGCDRFCSFCAIPYIRGPYHSFTFEDIDAAVSELEASGVREVTLIAQDTGRWGEDFDSPSNTARLLSRLAQGHPSLWFRLMYVEPVGVTDELLGVIATHDNVCKYLDVPLQHASKRILADMNRSGSRAEHLQLVKRIRDCVPGITLRTTVIVGFPGETDDDFQELLDFLEEAEFDYVGVFAYSAEEGTKAALLPHQVSEDVKIQRMQEVRDLADSISHARVAARIGSQMSVLVLGHEEDGQLYGRAMCQAPEVDGVTYLSSGKPGDIVSVTIDNTLLYEMEGE